MLLHLLGRLPSDGSSHIVPPVGCVLVVDSERPLERLSTASLQCYATSSSMTQMPSLLSSKQGYIINLLNTFGPGAQAVALRVSGDRAAFYACRFISFQDTVLDDAGRHYYKNCYIEGAIDVICGDGKALFEKCHLHSVSTNGGAFTAQRRGTAAEDTGYSFVGCKVTGVGKMILGRPWGLYSRVVFANTYMTNAVLPSGRCSSENTDLMDLDQMPQEELCGLTSFHSLKPCRSCRRRGSTVRIGSQTLHQSIHDIQKL
ncbi:putative pectinesterase 11 [Ananas comosus]|uniref:pectinesterase n=1 Tax=Ananas comosus TaxID=4615 RepID=A0A199V8S9_ANACO|nr:putative pectinesterase 11 [Ananas comosus]